MSEFALTNKTYGATPEEWRLFTHTLGLTPYILPVVSDPTRPTAPGSSLTPKTYQKTPSTLRNGRVGGFQGWTSYPPATEAQVEAWASNPAHGFCIRTGTVAALDIDVDDSARAEEIQSLIELYMSMLPDAPDQIPVRIRRNSSRVLIPYLTDTPIAKQVIYVNETGTDAIEILGTGNQFVAAGTHHSGYRYEWRNVDALPRLTGEQVDDLLTLLRDTFSKPEWGPPARTSSSSSSPKLSTQKNSQGYVGDEDDPLWQAIVQQGLATGDQSNHEHKAINIVCPYEDEHTDPDYEPTTSDTVYMPPYFGGHKVSHIKCLHAHCASRTRQQYMDKLTGGDDFEVLTADDGDAAGVLRHINRYGDENVCFTEQRGIIHDPMIEGMIPRVGVGVLYGPSGTYKSFLALEIAQAYARPDVTAFYGRTITRADEGGVLYIGLEGAEGTVKRILGYNQYHYGSQKILNGSAIIPLYTGSHAVDLTSDEGRAELEERMRSIPGGCRLLILDTFSKCLPNCDENSANDINKVLVWLDGVARRHQAAILLVHHTPKTGAEPRGSSAIRAGVDFMLSITTSSDKETGRRVELKIEKQKDSEIDREGIPIRPRKIVLGTQPNGVPITTLVIQGAVEIDGSSPFGAISRKPQILEADYIEYLKRGDDAADFEKLTEETELPPVETGARPVMESVRLTALAKRVRDAFRATSYKPTTHDKLFDVMRSKGETRTNKRRTLDILSKWVADGLVTESDSIFTPTFEEEK